MTSPLSGIEAVEREMKSVCYHGGTIPDNPTVATWKRQGNLWAARLKAERERIMANGYLPPEDVETLRDVAKHDCGGLYKKLEAIIAKLEGK